MSAWHAANHQWLGAALAELAARLAKDPEAIAAADVRIEEARAALPAPSALEQLAQSFRLTHFERDLLLLCAGSELDARFAESIGNRPVSFGFALGALPNAHWSALSPLAPLRLHRLIDVTNGPTLAESPLRIEERVLHFLLGVQAAEPQLAGAILPLADTPPLLPSQEELAQRMVALWSRDSAGAILLCGSELLSARAIAAAACAACGFQPYLMRAADVSAREALVRLWTREAILTRAALIIESDEDDSPETRRALAGFTERIVGPLVLSSREPPRGWVRTLVRLDVTPPSRVEQEQLWRAAMERLEVPSNGELSGILSQFRLSAASIQAVASEVKVAMNERLDTPLEQVAWNACKVQSRSRLEGLAQRIEPAADWDDLVLPAVESAALRTIAAHQRQRHRVYETWGFGKKGSRGLGLSALFAGQSGTGKTMAAEVLARDLNLDLFRIDLSQVVSKYIGETEKNLRRVFDAAEESGAILLFDEADALFGKRSEVKDSHDRYANIEVSYLLSRMESYRGLAVLTTNMKEALDHAFLRRLRFIVQFPFPDAGERARIWQRVFPPEVPQKGVDVVKLARLSVPGGNIRSIALHAAFLAADAGEPVQMKHLLQAAKTECAKIERAFIDREVAGWV